MSGPLPRVLAGPVVRRVERQSCSFWIALSVEATVRAMIWKGERTQPPNPDVDRPIASGDLKSRKIGVNLHVAVVTVDLTSGAPLDPGALYSYNLRFTFSDGTTSDLRGEKLLEDERAAARIPGVHPSAPLHLALGFQRDSLPTFLAPPSSFAGGTAVDGLRLAHCSCRRAGAGTFDAMAGITPLVRVPDRRPHQLYLTGDQIYADDIATTLLPLVIALGRDVMGADQPLPGFPPDPRLGGTGSTPVTGAGLPGNLANLPPMRRRWLMWQLAGFTGGATENHAMTFAEFAALYLLAWSPRTWRPIPAFAEVFNPPGIPGGATEPAPAIAPWLNRPWFCSAEDPSKPEEGLKRDWKDPLVNSDAFASFNRSAHHLARYAAVTPQVAQLLANTPTYMTFDDHEVADDWNLNGRWVTKVRSREWGRYVLRNGILAYALMQGWGNDPAHFTGDKPGRKLLDAIAPTTRGGPFTNVDILLGLDATTTAQPKRVAFDYTTGTEDYKVVVLDTRTHRAVNNTTLDPPNLIDNLDEQLPAHRETATHKVLIVISAVPAFTPVIVEQLGQPLATLYIDVKHANKIGDIPGFVPGDDADPKRRAGCDGLVERGNEKYDREGWSANEEAFEKFVARLATHRSVVVLSGDVHYASTTTLDYWAKTGLTARIVQCVASPLKAAFDDKVDQILRRVFALQRAEEVPMERLAWSARVEPSTLIPAGARISLARRSRLRREPVLVPSSPWPEGSKLPAAPEKGPDWRWRIRTVVDTTTTQAALPDALQLAVISETAKDMPINDQLREISRVHQERMNSNRPSLRRLVFAPNFGTVHFERRANGTDVVHTLYSPVSADPFPVSEREPLPAGRPADVNMAFGPHTVHRTALAAPTTDDQPEIIAGIRR